MHRTIEIVLNNSELTAGTRGASLGPSAIMVAARKQNSSFFGQLPLHPIPDFNYLLDQTVTTPFAKRIEGFTQVFHAIADKTSELLKVGKFPLILAGDHGSAAGTIAGICAANPNQRLGVVWIDAHGDLHSPYTTPSGNMHGMPLALSLGENNEACKRNELDKHTASAWSNLTSSHGITGKIKPENLCFVAVRDTEDEENHLIEKHHITNHLVEDVRKYGVAEIVSKIEAQLAQCDAIYVSFDVDSMDPEITSFGTGTPVGNGIFPDEARELLTALARNKKTVCMEFVEVNPCLDNKLNTMAETTFSLLESVVTALNEVN